jgi:hypothetical protein
MNGAGDRAGGHVARGIIVSPYHKDSWMVTSGKQYEIVQQLKIVVVVRQQSAACAKSHT